MKTSISSYLQNIYSAKVASQRDKIWLTTLDLIEWQCDFTAKDVLDKITENPPSKRTVRNTLNVIVEGGLLQSTGSEGSSEITYYPTEIGPPTTPGYTPRSMSSRGTFPYPGSKQGSADWIISHMPTHDTFCEVFAGSAAVTFQKPKSKYEVINDADEDLTQFFETVRDRGEELEEWLVNVPYSRKTYNQWVNAFYSGYRPENPVERAGRYFSLRYMQWVGVATAPNGFKVRAKRSPARTFDLARRRIRGLTERFSQVTIENKNYRSIVSSYDDTDISVLFYLDPPYPGKGNLYSEKIPTQEFLNCLQSVESDWMLSYPEVPDQLNGEDITVLAERPTTE